MGSLSISFVTDLSVNFAIGFSFVSFVALSLAVVCALDDDATLELVVASSFCWLLEGCAVVCGF